MKGNLQDWLPLIGVWVAVIVMFWFGVIAPRRKELKEHKELIAGLKKGDRVVTAGGVHGRVIGFKNGTVRLEIAQGVSILVDRAAVRRKLSSEA